ncbi:MAG: DUF1080 domain-containing protein [Acidobacteria bacterium]|nr:DUF1080 domain-containing protein [Acidobacteriota bacterium]
MRSLLFLALLGGSLAAQAADFEAANGPTPEFLALRSSFENPAEGWTPLFNGKDLSGWHPQDYSPRPQRPWDWTVPALIALDPSDDHFLLAKAFPAGSPLTPAVVADHEGKSANLVSDREFADAEVYVEYVMSRKTNAGVCLMGNYEIQLYDSVGVADSDLTVTDNGAIYAYRGKKGRVGGSPPRVNASRGAGEWQSVHIWFRAPRFQDGKKVENARFLKVLLNGVEVQRNYELLYSTRAVPPWEERPVAPLLLQGDHGPVAFRNGWIRELRPQ